MAFHIFIGKTSICSNGIKAEINWRSINISQRSSCAVETSFVATSGVGESGSRPHFNLNTPAKKRTHHSVTVTTTNNLLFRCRVCLLSILSYVDAQVTVPLHHLHTVGV